MMSSISVIVPVYKVEKYLSRCIDSILNQTIADFDLILVDDGSPDHSGVICDEYAKKDKRIVVIHQENKGAAAARNNGIEYALLHSQSRWLSFVDSDDWVEPDYLESLLNSAESSDCSISVCGYEKTDKLSLQINFGDCKKIILSAKKFIFENDIRAIVPWGKLYRKELWREMRFPEGRICEDEYTTYKILLKSGKICLINSPLYIYYQNSESVMNEQWNKRRLDGVDAHRDRYEYLREYYPDLADEALIRLWKSCRYQGQMALRNLDSDDLAQTFDYLNGVMKDYKLPWKLVFSENPKEIIWLSMQKARLKTTCKIRNILSIGL